jgi:hypothetical protein
MSDHKSIYENAIISIKLGIEDYQSKSPDRHISAVRNFYAGVLLLGKYCLLTKAPYVDPMQILATSLKPILNGDNEVIYVSKGQSTVDLNDLQNRFKDFHLPWPKANINELQKLRNNLEHFHASDSKGRIQQIIAGCFPLVEGFLEIVGEEPADSLGQTWQFMTTEKSFFNAKKKQCDDSLLNISFTRISPPYEVTCDDCESLLLYQTDANNDDSYSMEIKCKSCGEEMSSLRFIEKMIGNEFGADDYRSITQGGSPSIHDCPGCSEPTYVYSGDVNECYNCGESIDKDCARCGTELTVENMSCNHSSYCDYCDHVMSKDD